MLKVSTSGNPAKQFERALACSTHLKWSHFSLLKIARALNPGYVGNDGSAPWWQKFATLLLRVCIALNDKRHSITFQP